MLMQEFGCRSQKEAWTSIDCEIGGLAKYEFVVIVSTKPTNLAQAMEERHERVCRFPSWRSAWWNPRWYVILLTRVLHFHWPWRIVNYDQGARRGIPRVHRTCRLRSCLE